MSMQSLKKISQKLLKLESGNEALTDGRTDTQNVKIFEVYNNTPPLKKWRGIKMGMLLCRLYLENSCFQKFQTFISNIHLKQPRQTFPVWR